MKRERESRRQEKAREAKGEAGGRKRKEDKQRKEGARAALTDRHVAGVSARERNLPGHTQTGGGGDGGRTGREEGGCLQWAGCVRGVFCPQANCAVPSSA